MNNWLEAMESRVLFSGGLTTSGSAFPIVTLPVNTAYTGGAIGSNDLFVAYQKNNQLMGQIVDTSGGSVVPEFRISNVGQSVPAYTSLATTKDANGNAVVVYSVIGSNFSPSLYIARVSPAGSVVDAPVLIPASSSVNEASAAIALGANNSVMVTWVDYADPSGNQLIFARGFDGSDSPLFGVTRVSPTTSAAHEFLKTPAIIYNASAGNFLVAWSVQDYDTSYTGTLGALEDRTISATGVLGVDATVVSTPQGGNSNNTVQQPVMVGSGIGTTVEQFGSSGAGYPFAGSLVPWGSFNADGSIRQAPMNVFTTMSPEEVIAVGGIASDSSHTTVLLKDGTFNGSQFQESSVEAVTVNDDDGSVAAHNALLLVGIVGDPVDLPFFGFIFATPVTPGNASSDITVSGQATSYTAPAATSTPPVVTVSVGHEADSKHMVFFVSLDKATDHDVTVHYKTVAGSAVAGTNFQPIDDAVVTIPAGSTSEQVTVALTSPPISSAIFDLVISQPSGATLGSPTDGSATIRAEDVNPFLLLGFYGGGTQIPPSLPGDPVKAAEKVSVTNSSSSTVKETVTTQIYLAPDVTDTSTWIAFAPKSVTSKINLKPGKSTTVTIKPGSIPPTTPPGTYSVVTKTTEPNGATDTAVSDKTVTVKRAYVDLTGSFSKLPVTVTRGKNGVVNFNVTEIGTLPVKGKVTVLFSLSPDGQSADATFIGQSGKNVNLVQGKSAEVTLKGAVAETLAAGDYFVIAQITGPSNVFNDVDLSNNTVVSSTKVTVN